MNIKINNNDDDLIALTDLSLASALSLTIPILDIDISNPKQAIFYFKNSKELKETIDSFWNETLHVSPLNYFNAIKNLKSRMYQKGRYV